jgi:UDP-2-acetamido-2,6-beta-L-arabino-hexul-4-ose reductase
MKIVVTGANGFLGKNLCVRLREKELYEVLEISRDTSADKVSSLLAQADFVFHLAGVNRPKDVKEFKTGNIDLTKSIVEILQAHGRHVPIALASSTKTDQHGDYGKSKLAAEKIVENYSKITGAPNYIYRLPNVFGKWSKPNYNSFIATFCYNIMNDIDISIHDPNALVKLVYIDDVCNSFLKLLQEKTDLGLQKVFNEYSSTVGEVASIISSFKSCRQNLIIEPVGVGLKRALYSTFLSYASPEQFSYSITNHTDERGMFCEMLKTVDSGQISFFTAHPGITRGGHYHHTKTEKFLVIKGTAQFKFKNINTGDTSILKVTGSTPTIVDTVPGWAHDITNIGVDDLIVMLWANEIFDPLKTDTIAELL